MTHAQTLRLALASTVALVLAAELAVMEGTRRRSTTTRMRSIRQTTVHTATR